VPSLTDPASGGWSDYSPGNSGNQSRSRRRWNLSDWHYAKGGSRKSSAQVLSMLIALIPLIALNAASPLITLTYAWLPYKLQIRSEIRIHSEPIGQ
jgi:hypothetical protein